MPFLEGSPRLPGNSSQEKASQTPVPAQGFHSRRPDEELRDQTCPDGEPKDPVEVDEPKDESAKSIFNMKLMMCEISELTEPDQAAEYPARRNDQAEEHPARRNDQAEEHPARRRDQAEEHPARRRDQAEEHPARKRDQAEEHPARKRDQAEEHPARKRDQAEEHPPRKRDQAEEHPPRRRDQAEEHPAGRSRVYSWRQRQRMERPLYNSEGPYPNTYTVLRLYSPFIPIGLVPVGMVCRYQDGNVHWVSATNAGTVLIPVVGTGSYFMQTSFVSHVFQNPWFFTQ